MFRRLSRAEWLLLAGAIVGGVASAATATLISALVDIANRLF